ncbi:NAD(P)/FAD-dependent oxidoreductase [candidate division KSB1 bacterium]|nr:NAD(P)/FAD-dependent oxidoreductase [candidate division KSB1 bacterium]
MSNMNKGRREFCKSVMGIVPMMTLDWSAFPKGANAGTDTQQYDAIIIGSGLGGLSCAAAFARQGFKVLVLEQHNRPGGYATSFKRPGGFVFDVSLHSTSVPERDGVHNLIPGFPEITDVEFLPHPDLYRVIYPDYDIQVPQRNLEAYINTLAGHFPEEKEGIIGIYDDMLGLSDDIQKLSNAGNNVDMSRFPTDFPYLYKCYSKTWGQVVDERIISPKLKAIISSQWGYYGLPPSRLASFYYALPAIGYLKTGGFYPRDRSQKISNALVQFIEQRGGKVMLKTRVGQVLVKEQAAYGVKTDKGEEFKGKVVISNANAYDTFTKMLKAEPYLTDYIAKWDQYSVSYSSFQIFLGLKQNLVGQSGITSSEIFYESGYDMDEGYANMQKADVENCGFGVTLYDNIYHGYSPEGKNTLNIIALQGFSHWEKYETDYFKGNKTAYRKEKERMADILIHRVEETLLPGLSEAIEVKEIGTPLTNVRYTGNYRGAIYGWDQTLNNSGQNRVPHNTPIKNLYLAGAWTKPGHGYGGVLWSGLECFGEIMRNWQF